MKRTKLEPGDIVKRNKALGLVMRNESELLVAYPGADELTIESESDVSKQGKISDIEKPKN